MRRFLPVLLTAAAGLILLMGLYLRPFGGDPSALCDFGAASLVDSAAYRRSAERYFREGFVVKDGASGYDGQYYFFVACDPLALRTEGGYGDAYYWQRILHPALAWALAGGDPARIPAAMALVTLLAILGGTAALLALLPLGGARWWALAYAFAVAHLYGLQLSLGGPALSLALTVAGVLAWTRGRGLLCALCLALALLARESALLALGPLAVWSWKEGRRRDALLAVAAILPFLVWEAYLHSRLGRWGLGTSGGHLTLPFLGMLRRAGLWQGSGVDFAATSRGVANNAVLLVFLAYGAWSAWDAVRAWFGGERTLAGWLYLAHAAFFCCLTAGQFVDLNGASRPFLPVLPFQVLVRARGRRGVLWAGLAFAAAVALKLVLSAPPPFHRWSV